MEPTAYNIDGIALGMSEHEVQSQGFIPIFEHQVGSSLSGYRKSPDAASQVTVSHDKVIEVCGEVLSLDGKPILQVGVGVEGAGLSVVEALGLPRNASTEESFLDSPPDAVFFLWCCLEVYIRDNIVELIRLATEKNSWHFQPGDATSSFPTQWSVDCSGKAIRLK